MWQGIYKCRRGFINVAGIFKCGGGFINVARDL